MVNKYNKILFLIIFRFFKSFIFKNKLNVKYQFSSSKQDHPYPT